MDSIFAEKMYIYSVTVAIDKSIEKEWLDWMIRAHIPDVLNTGCFYDYSIYQVFSAHAEDTATYNVQYFFEKVEDIEKYQKECALSLQKEHKERFENKFVATRTVLKKINL